MAEQREKDTPTDSEAAKFELTWRKGEAAPCTMNRTTSDALVDSDAVYVHPGNSLSIYSYNSVDNTWKELGQKCKGASCSLALVNNLLTTIGGVNDGKVMNQLFSITDGLLGRKKWKEVYPPMPTKRSQAIVASLPQALVVAGGVGDNHELLKTVEVMEIATQEWSAAADLPEGLFNASVTICGGRIYVLGGHDDKGNTANTVYTCKLSDLFYSCQSKAQAERLFKSVSPSGIIASNVWSKVADLPATGFGSTCVTLNNRLLSLGGSNSEKKETNADIRIYDEASNQWEVIGQMTQVRELCFAAVLPNNEVMIVGGYTGGWMTQTDSVEIGTIV